jgi:putative peptide maturation dehydrogenase
VASALTGETEPLARKLLALLFSVPQTRWQERADSPALRYLCRRGLLVSEDDAYETLRERDAQLADLGWHPAAAVYHFSVRSRGDRAGDVDYDRLVRRLGPPPPTFPPARDGSRTPLPAVARSGRLYDVLERRRTRRRFDRSRPLGIEQAAVLLSEAFRARRRLRLHDELEVLYKSSPSAGALHPVEAYPLVRNVDGLEPGLYHYAASDHAVERFGDLTDADVTDFTAGQEWFASAPLALVLAVRFRRSYWKYRDHPTAYTTLLMDAAHLSQTLYLISADLGLAAFFTSRVNAGDIDDRLGLDGIEEGALAVWGCGYPAGRR